MRRVLTRERDLKDLEALKLVDDGVPVRAACREVGIPPGSFIRLRLDIKDDEKAELAQEGTD